MKMDCETILSDGRKLCAWWANNTGRGRNNCTLALVPGTTERATYNRHQRDVISRTTTSSWRGDVNLSRAVRERLGISGLTIQREVWRSSDQGGAMTRITETVQL